MTVKEFIKWVEEHKVFFPDIEDYDISLVKWDIKGIKCTLNKRAPIKEITLSPSEKRIRLWDE